MSYIVTTIGDWYLRQDSWAGSIERAKRFPTEAAAREAIAAAARFTKPASVKAAQIIPEPAPAGEGG
jgi:hypothetical protein